MFGTCLLSNCPKVCSALCLCFLCTSKSALTFLKYPAEVVEPDSDDEPYVAPKRRGRGSKAAAAAKGQVLGSVDNTSGILPGNNEAGEGLLEVHSPRSLRRPLGGAYGHARAARSFCSQPVCSIACAFRQVCC